jgi:hypothetical protein
MQDFIDRVVYSSSVTVEEEQSDNNIDNNDVANDEGLEGLTPEEQHYVDAQEFIDAETNQEPIESTYHECSPGEYGISVADIGAGIINAKAIQRLEGIVIDIAGKDVILHKDDADKLKELMLLCKDHGLRIKDVVTS